MFFIVRNIISVGTYVAEVLQVDVINLLGQSFKLTTATCFHLIVV
jgi:hypothetical protein